jgi:hypothetical protein
MYKSTFFLPWHYLEVSGHLHAPAALPPYPLDKRLDGPKSRPGRRGEKKILEPIRTRTPTPQSSSRYTDYASVCSAIIFWAYETTLLSVHIPRDFVVFYVVRVISKEMRRLAFPRTSFVAIKFCINST